MAGSRQAWTLFVLPRGFNFGSYPCVYNSKDARANRKGRRSHIRRPDHTAKADI